MAKVTGPIDRHVIRRFKGKLDFYQIRGQTYVRSWPRRPRWASTAQISRQWPHLLSANHAYRYLHPTLYWLYRTYNADTLWTPRDFFMKHYFGTVPESPRTYDFCGHPLSTPCPDPHGHYWALTDVWGGFDGGRTLRVNLLSDRPIYWHVLTHFDRPRFEELKIDSPRYDRAHGWLAYRPPGLEFQHWRTFSPTYQINLFFDTEANAEAIDLYFHAYAGSPIDGHLLWGVSPFFGFRWLSSLAVSQPATPRGLPLPFMPMHDGTNAILGPRDWTPSLRQSDREPPPAGSDIPPGPCTLP